MEMMNKHCDVRTNYRYENFANFLSGGEVVMTMSLRISIMIMTLMMMTVRMMIFMIMSIMMIKKTSHS